MALAEQHLAPSALVHLYSTVLSGFAWSFVAVLARAICTRRFHSYVNEGGRGSRKLRFLSVLVMLGVSSLLGVRANAENTLDWSSEMRSRVSRHQLGSALKIVELRLSQNPTDLEAQGWHARILSWQGFWCQAELEYKQVLERAPNDVDILTGLSDVLVWEDTPAAALPLVEHALKLSPGSPDLLLRRGKILQILGRRSEAVDAYKDVLTRNPDNRDAKRGLLTLRADTRHELRVGDDVDLLSYATNAQSESISIASRWNQRWSTQFVTSAWQRFDESALKLSGSASLRISHQNSLSLSGAVADDHKVIPHSEFSFEYGHGFRISNGFLRGYEVSYQQGWLWYRDAHVLTLGATQLFYFPREWMWTLAVRGARTGFSSLPLQWTPSGFTKLQIPVIRAITAQSFFAVGTENFGEIDQIGQLSSRTLGGGLRYRFTVSQDITGYAAVQNRSMNQSQISFGLSYGIHF